MKTRAVLLLGGMLLLSSFMFGVPCLATPTIASDMNVAVGGNLLIGRVALIAWKAGSRTSNRFSAFSVASDTKMATYNGVTILNSYEPDVFGTGASAVPEPFTLSLVGFGLIGLGAVGRKKVRNK